MSIIRSNFIAAIFVTALTSLAQAETKSGAGAPDPEFAREKLERLYRLEQAFLLCEHVLPTGRELARLDGAIFEAEQTAGFSEMEIDSIYRDVADQAERARADFCVASADAGQKIRILALTDRAGSSGR